MILDPKILDQQIQALFDAAPQDAETLSSLRAIAPALKQLANRLHHPQYYVIQSLDQNWALSHLQMQEHSEEKTTLLFAFPTLKDTVGGPYPLQDPNLIALPIPTIELLFQFLSLDMVDCLVFYEKPGDFETAVELHRSEFMQLIQEHLQPLAPQATTNPAAMPTPIPADIA